MHHNLGIMYPRTYHITPHEPHALVWGFVLYTEKRPAHRAGLFLSLLLLRLEVFNHLELITSLEA